ncbi:MAG: polysaccharide biosynthesis tyrosine autokinase [Bacteroidia bacterium]
MADKKGSNIIEMDDIRSFLKVFSKNWYILILAVIVSAVIAYFYTYKLPDIYAAKSQVLLKSDQTYDYQTKLYNGLGYYPIYQDNANQIRVLTSNDLIEKALEKLKLDVSYYIVGRLKTTEVYDAMPFDFSAKLLDGKLYEKEIRFKILDKQRFRITYQKGDKEVVKEFPFDKDIYDNDFVLNVKKNDNINDKTIQNISENDYMIKVHNMGSMVGHYKGALSVEEVENTSILELSVEDEIAARAITFLDTLSKVYIDYTASAQYTVNENTLNNIDKQLAGVTEVLTSIEDDLENYKANKEVLDLPKQEDQYFDKLVEYDAQKRELELWIGSLEALEKYIIAIGEQKDEKLLPPSFYIGKDDDYLKTAINELYTLQMNRNSRLFNSTEENKNISELDQTVVLLKKNILTYIKNSKEGIQNKIKDIDKQIADYTAIIKGIPKTQRDLLTIQRKVDVNEKMYVYLLEQRANTIIARAGILPQTDIIESAHSIGIIKPNKRKILYYFMTVGLLLSLIVVFIRTVLFSTIENILELKRLTSLPVLGEVLLSDDAKFNYIIVDKDPKSAVTESFRAIRTNLEYMASNARSKVILITSYNPGEGKTFCSVNLATILAKAGKKVLILELDLHKPKVQKALNMSSEMGVSTVLIGRNTIEEAILTTEIENLSVVLSGPTPPNASEIILSPQLSEIMEYGRTHYDYVIVDTPPVGLITDALVIMKHVDVSLFVLNAKYAKKQIVKIAEEIVEANKLKNFGLILNGVKRTRRGYYNSYGYGYGYGYGYSYGYGYGGYGYGNSKKK